MFIIHDGHPFFLPVMELRFDCSSDEQEKADEGDA
jgi:hypothetical protein